MLIASGFSWFHLLPGLEHELPVVGAHGHQLAAAWLACLVAIGFGLIARGQLERAKARSGVSAYEPASSFGALAIAETVVGGFKGLMDGMMEPQHTRRWLPFTAGIAIFIFCCNVQGLLPGFLPPTDQLAMNTGMALTVMFVYLGVGLTSDPVGFVKHMVGPVWWLIPLIGLIELATFLFIRPFSLSIRLAANMFGDHQVFLAMSDISQQIPAVGVLTGALIPLPFLVLGLLVCTIQAGVFALLTTVYISMALPHGEHHDDHGDHGDHGDGHHH
ncbi:MAG TPA: F0F1 ATP synthase subunit A [Myxococcota bacterium]|nr:F0F1 ATP synthase subunit A [Myxococcota bacterium]